MTLNKILSLVDEMQPNAVSKELKVQFLNEVEAEVFDTMIQFFPAEEVLKTNFEQRRHLWPKKKPESESNSTSEFESESESDSTGTSETADDTTIEDSSGSASEKEETETTTTEKEEEHEKITVSLEQKGGTDIGDPLNMGFHKKHLSSVKKLIPYEENEDEAVLLLDDRFAGVYTSYIKAKINYTENEIEAYTNDAMMHDAEINAWKTWMVRNHERIHPPVKGLI